MGKNANAGLVVGVLTGSGTRDQLLSTGAHVVLQNVAELPILLKSAKILELYGDEVEEEEKAMVPLSSTSVAKIRV